MSNFRSLLSLGCYPDSQPFARGAYSLLARPLRPGFNYVFEISIPIHQEGIAWSLIPVVLLKDRNCYFVAFYGLFIRKLIGGLIMHLSCVFSVFN